MVADIGFALKQPSLIKTSQLLFAMLLRRYQQEAGDDVSVYYLQEAVRTVEKLLVGLAITDTEPCR